LTLSKPQGGYFMKSACPCLCPPREEIQQILKSEYFKGNEIWAIYPPSIYDSECIGPDEISDFFLRFLADRQKKMKSLFSLSLYCLLFRPHLMDEADFEILRQSIQYFDEDEKCLCIQCGRIIIP